jgi:hypothetical protein
MPDHARAVRTNEELQKEHHARDHPVLSAREQGMDCFV